MRNGGYRIGKVDLLLQLAENQKSNKFWTLIYVREGVGMCLIDGHLKCLNEGDILFFPPRVAYSFASADLGDEYNASIDVVVFRFDGVWLDSLLKTFQSLSGAVLSLKEQHQPLMAVGPKWMKMSVLMSDLCSADPHGEAVLVLDLIGHLSKDSDMIPLTASIAQEQDVSARREKIDRYISCHQYGRITLDDISAYAGMNRSYFCLFFKKHYGMRFTDYINARKIELACRLLADPHNAISDVAEQCGFTSVTYFNRVFKATKGVSPTEHRNSSCS